MRKWNKKNKKQIHNYTHEIYVENTCTSCKMRSPMSQTLRSAYYYSPVIIILFPDKKTIILSGVYCIHITLMSYSAGKMYGNLVILKYT